HQCDSGSTVLPLDRVRKPRAQPPLACMSGVFNYRINRMISVNAPGGGGCAYARYGSLARQQALQQVLQAFRDCSGQGPGARLPQDMQAASLREDFVVTAAIL